jgi:hypothetical protein
MMQDGPMAYLMLQEDSSFMPYIATRQGTLSL